LQSLSTATATPCRRCKTDWIIVALVCGLAFAQLAAKFRMRHVRTNSAPKYRDVAEALGIHLGTVHRHLSRIRKLHFRLYARVMAERQLQLFWLEWYRIPEVQCTVSCVSSEFTEYCQETYETHETGPIRAPLGAPGKSIGALPAKLRNRCGLLCRPGPAAELVEAPADRKHPASRRPTTTAAAAADPSSCPRARDRSRQSIWRRAAPRAGRPRQPQVCAFRSPRYPQSC
jgi:hypothetical protein